MDPLCQCGLADQNLAHVLQECPSAELTATVFLAAGSGSRYKTLGNGRWSQPDSQFYGITEFECLLCNQSYAEAEEIIIIAIIYFSISIIGGFHNPS